MITRRARASRVKLLASAPLLALVTLAAGCGTASTPPSGSGTGTRPPSATGTAPATTPASPASPGSPAPVPTTTGGTITPGVPSCSGWPSKAVHGALPASFVPVAVLRCVSSYQTVPGKGQWLAETLERADTGLAPLIAALRRPPGQRAPGVMCPDLAMVPPQIALIGANASALIPRLPLDGCGIIQQQVLGALAALPWKPVSVRLISQVQTQAQVGSGCTSMVEDPFLVYGSPRSSPGGDVYTTRPASLRICVYSSAGTNASQFLRAATVTGATENVLLAGLSGARGSSLCTLPHPMFAVVQGEGARACLVYVELGGCHRVLRYVTGSTGLMGLSTGQASPQAVAVIERVTRPES